MKTSSTRKDLYYNSLFYFILRSSLYIVLVLIMMTQDNKTQNEPQLKYKTVALVKNLPFCFLLSSTL